MSQYYKLQEEFLEIGSRCPLVNWLADFFPGQ